MLQASVLKLSDTFLGDLQIFSSEKSGLADFNKKLWVLIRVQPYVQRLTD